MQLTPHFTSEELLYTSEVAYIGHQEELLETHPGKLYMLAGFAERVREQKDTKEEQKNIAGQENKEEQKESL